MTPDEYAAELATALDIAQETAPRSLQRHLGISDIGNCHQETLFKLRRVDPTDHTEGWQALFGTAVGDTVERARAAARPGLLHQVKVKVTLPSGRIITGTADEVDQDEPSVTDFKSKDDEGKLELQRKQGSTLQQRFQRHTCYLGAHQAGLVPPEGIVRNAYVARSGKGAPVVEQEPFSMDVVREADAWLGDVYYAAEHDEDASRDKHYGWCAEFCTFFTKCREGDDVLTRTVTDPQMIAAAAQVRESRAVKRRHDLLEKAAKGVLKPLQHTPNGGIVAYETPSDRLRWAWVNDKGGYYKLDVKQRAS